METRRRFRFLPGSIRFRLTAWYALLLALVLVVLGFSVHELTEDRLREDVDHRLKKTATDIEVAVMRSDPKFGRHNGEPSLEGTNQQLDSFAARGLLVQVVSASDRVIVHSRYAPDRVLLAGSAPAGTTKSETRTIRVNDVDVRVVRDPILLRDDNRDHVAIGAILVGERLDPLYGTLRSLRRTLLSASVVGLALAIVGGWLLAGQALRPVDRVTATAATIAAGDGSAASLATRLRVPDTGDEIARLSATFNAMLDRLHASFVAQQRFVADASHELRTPLTAIRGNVEVLARQVAAGRAGVEASEDIEAALTDIGRESQRMGRLIDDLLLLARTDAPAVGTHRPRPVRLDDLAREAVRSAAALATGQRLEVAAPHPMTVDGDPDRLLQLLLILLENALRHTPAGNRVAVEVEPAVGGRARLVVRDEGEGIAPEHLPHLFDRFYRADGARGRATGGTGLGLAIARAIVRTHGGEIAVVSAPGQGSAFTVTLPAVTASWPAPEAPGARDQAVTEANPAD